jgi:SAM-dependent methyltransferase
MRGFDPMASFGEDIATTYDDVPRGDEVETVTCLQQLAGGGPVLELAIGTGRIGLPLAATGLRVEGIEQSAAMIARLREKPGSEAISVIQGDMADVPVSGRYRLIFLVFNTFYNLLTQDDQVRCFENVARHLEDNGVFLLEAAMPGPKYRLDQQYVGAEAVELGKVVLDVGRYDPTTQLLDEVHVTLAPEGVRLFPIVTRFAWPSEIDLMARLAGLRLHSRWGGWQREPFTADSWRHVSIYGR